MTLCFSKQELADALELYVGSTHPALLGHFEGGCDFSFSEHPNTGELSELVVTFRPRKSVLVKKNDETQIFTKA